MRTFNLIIMSGCLLLSAPAASAQAEAPSSPPQNVIAIGAGIMPEHTGSDESVILPVAFGQVQIGRAQIELGGLGLRANLSPDSRFSVGPVIGARLPRDDADGAVGRLPELDVAVEAGGFIGYQFGGSGSGRGPISTDLSIVHDVSGVHDGLLATAAARYGLIRQRNMSLSIDTQITWASEDYMQTYFGVTDRDAAQSGLDTFRPDAGFRDIGAGFTAGYWFGPSLGVIGRAGVSYLVGDPADSPVVDDGSRWQPVAALTLAYRY